MTKSWKTDPDPLNRPLHVPLRLVLRHADQPTSEKCQFMMNKLQRRSKTLFTALLNWQRNFQVSIVSLSKFKLLPPFLPNGELPPFSLEICWYLFPFHQNWDLSKKSPNPVDSGPAPMNDIRSLWWAVCNALHIFSLVSTSLVSSPGKKELLSPFKSNKFAYFFHWWTYFIYFFALLNHQQSSFWSGW